jgi:heat shock protein HslJ
MNTKSLLLCVMLGAGLTTLSGCSLMSPPPAITGAASVPLLDTHWRVTLIGEEVIDNPSGERDVHITLQSTNNAVTGDSGCNRMFGHYALENDMLKFDGLGGTKMFCEARMELEQKFTNALMATMRWKIAGRTLTLLDESGKGVATFEASPATG